MNLVEFPSVVLSLCTTLMILPKVSCCVSLFDLPFIVFTISTGRQVSPLILFKQLQVEGFIVTRWLSEWPKAFKEMAAWIEEVLIQLCED